MRKLLVIVAALLGMACAAGAQNTSTEPKLIASAGGPKLSEPAAEQTMIAPAGEQSFLEAPSEPRLKLPSGEHRFFDKENLAIFFAVAAARTMDPISTWQFRRHGLQEAELSDAFVDNKPLFAAYSASMVAGQVAACYMFHRLGWHRMERLSGMIHTAVVTEAVVHNYNIGYTH